MTPDEAVAILRNCLYNVLILIEDQPQDWRSRSLTLVRSALSQTNKPVSTERTLKLGINEDFDRIFKS